MDLYEYQGKQLFKRFGIPVSEGRPAKSPEEARAAAEELGGPVVVKAQVLTGGRGKAGAVELLPGIGCRPDAAATDSLVLAEGVFGWNAEVCAWARGIPERPGRVEAR